MDAYNQASDGEVRAIILNFEGLEYMNSSGIGLLVTLLIRVNREKQRLMTYGLSEHYRSIFQITRLDDAIAIHETEAEAVRAFVLEVTNFNGASQGNSEKKTGTENE